ncbi:HAD-IB family hydrolase [Vibrio ruber]|uniref:HAD family hydrolase n=1 Tax=Vibrio ruber TaxID=184755 RepID=UPI002892FFCD|nr:HAD-IB family hydrolase [Vibrio ruber]WNJ97261.1 HAD-IB family hydrolase [Vibrio ruber]
MNIAFFDFDETVITGKSMFIFLKEYSQQYRLKCGLSFYEVMDSINELSDAGVSREDINRYYYSILKDEEQSQIRMVAENIFYKKCYHFNVMVVEKIKFHQKRGDDVVFVSGAMKDIIYPMMKALGVQHSLCSEPIVKDGYYTGELSKVSIGYHKAEHASKYAKSYNQSLVDCYAYGDHISDLDLLLLVGNPCAVNPSSGLLNESQRRGWPILISS